MTEQSIAHVPTYQYTNDPFMGVIALGTCSCGWSSLDGRSKRIRRPQRFAEVAGDVWFHLNGKDVVDAGGLTAPPEEVHHVVDYLVEDPSPAHRSMLAWILTGDEAKTNVADDYIAALL